MANSAETIGAVISGSAGNDTNGSGNGLGGTGSGKGFGSPGTGFGPGSGNGNGSGSSGTGIALTPSELSRYAETSLSGERPPRGSRRPSASARVGRRSRPDKTGGDQQQLRQRCARPRRRGSDKALAVSSGALRRQAGRKLVAHTHRVSPRGCETLGNSFRRSQRQVLSTADGCKGKG